jgi:DNA-binding Lrp family transcriptional regulator
VPGAFVLVSSEVGKELQVLDELKKLQEIDEAYAVSGVYDVVVKVKESSMTTLKDLINRRIKRIDGIESTITMYVNDRSNGSKITE